MAFSLSHGDWGAQGIDTIIKMTDQFATLAHEVLISVPPIPASDDRRRLRRPNACMVAPACSLHYGFHVAFVIVCLELFSDVAHSSFGAQLSLVFRDGAENVHKIISDQGVICDLRKPSVMRIAPAPLYNSFQDVLSFVELLAFATTKCAE